MFHLSSFELFLAAALVIAITPGPGIFYVGARSLAGGRAEGIASTLGTAVGGMVHVVAATLGLSALIMVSADAFAVLKIFGAIYLVYLGIKTWRSASALPAMPNFVGGNSLRAFRGKAFKEGVVVEVLNPKTALFFLAFIPQFVAPEAGRLALQFLILGTISVALNTAVDFLVVALATGFRDRFAKSVKILPRLTRLSGAVMCGLGVALALARRPG